MLETFHSYEPRVGYGLKHDPFNAIVGPRPIGWISTVGQSGQVNLAPYSFFNAFNYVPPIIGFSSIGYKDTLRNAEQTGEFVWNLATRSLAEAMNQICASVALDVSEFELANLTQLRSTIVKAPRVPSGAGMGQSHGRAARSGPWATGDCLIFLIKARKVTPIARLCVRESVVGRSWTARGLKRSAPPACQSALRRPVGRKPWVHPRREIARQSPGESGAVP